MLGATGVYLSRSEYYMMLVIETFVVGFDDHTSIGVHPGVRVGMAFGSRCKEMKRPRASHQSSHGINNPSLWCCIVVPVRSVAPYFNRPGGGVEMPIQTSKSHRQRDVASLRISRSRQSWEKIWWLNRQLRHANRPHEREMRIGEMRIGEVRRGESAW